jgi:3-hydroxyacyl-[acyl-carrier-protein] dehydratase
LLNEVQMVSSDTLDARACVPKDSIWFTGHFPGEPILPGIALLHTVYDAILSKAGNGGESVKVSSLKRIRFTGPVRPGEMLLLSVTREGGIEEILYNFKVFVKETIVCSGLMTVTKR